MRPQKQGRKWYLRRSLWALALWSALWVGWLIVAGAPVEPLGIAVLGFILLSALALRNRDERRIEDWERRKREAQALEALERDALEAKEFEREVAELEKKQGRR